MNNTVYISLVSALSLSVSGLCAETIQQNKNAQGVVEFSNIKPSSSKQQTIIYSYSEPGSTTVFTDQKPTHVTDYDVLKFDCYACNPASTINWNTVRLNHKSYVKTVKEVAQSYQVDPALVRALIHAESAFNAKARSHKGASGLMQLMPATAKELGVSNVFDPQQNIQGGVKYLAQLLNQFNGNTRLATAAYNAGPGAVKKYNGIPPYKETEVYVERVSILHRRYQNES